jgi:4-amino-4-deoxy-L-arabinose transferase-like glycosyltransferase
MQRTTGWQRVAAIGLLAVAVWGFSYRLGAVPLLDDPNEGEYAEVAREMLESGEWISPQLNYTPFLNKPPLEYWLIGAADRVLGVNELAARLPSAAAGLAIVLLVVSLGTTLFDLPTGMLAGLVLTTMGGFFVETHEVRPDLPLTAGIVGALAAFVHLLRVPPGAADWNRRARWPLLGWQLSLAIGWLAKGMLALLLPALVCAAVIIGERRLDLVRRLLRPRAWWLLVLLVAPWPLAVTLRHPGFAWDYVVNQHLLFFFDRKLPRDSVPVSLPVFWAALGLRLFPWTIFAPVGVVAAWQRRRRWPDGSGDRLLLAWLAAVLLFFSAASSRMEHYSIPALPAFALALARLFREYATETRARRGGLVTAHVVVFAVLAVAGPFVVPRLVAAQEWLAPIGDFTTLARGVFTLLAAGLLVAAAAALTAWRAGVAPLIAATFLVAVPQFHRGLTLVARVNSSAPLAADLRAVAAPQDAIVFEAPVEYQTCAGLNFYLRRRLDLLRPADFVPPPYLRPHVDELFISRLQLEELWRSARVYFVTDPLNPRPASDGVTPRPASVVARDYQRRVVTNGAGVGGAADAAAHPEVPAEESVRARVIGPES